MAIILYGTELSPPVRAVMAVCKALGIEYEFKKVDLLAGEHMKPEFLKINPMHTVPTIQDGDFTLWDSHAIATYLADKSEDDSWYPKDLKKRAIVNQRLHFDNALLFTRLRDMLEPIVLAIKGGEAISSLAAEKVKRLEDSLVMLGDLIQEDGWLAGDNPTIADCCAAATVTSIIAVHPTIKTPAKVASWLKKCEQSIPEFSATNQPGATGLGEAIRGKLAGQ